MNTVQDPVWNLNHIFLVTYLLLIYVKLFVLDRTDGLIIQEVATSRLNYSYVTQRDGDL